MQAVPSVVYTPVPVWPHRHGEGVLATCRDERRYARQVELESRHPVVQSHCRRIVELQHDRLNPDRCVREVLLAVVVHRRQRSRNGVVVKPLHVVPVKQPVLSNRLGLSTLREGIELLVALQQRDGRNHLRVAELVRCVPV